MARAAVWGTGHYRGAEGLDLQEQGDLILLFQAARYTDILQGAQVVSALVHPPDRQHETTIVQPPTVSSIASLLGYEE